MTAPNEMTKYHVGQALREIVAALAQAGVTLRQWEQGVGAMVGVSYDRGGESIAICTWDGGLEFTLDVRHETSLADLIRAHVTLVAFQWRTRG